MSVDFEERLRSEMAAVEVRPRSGLVREAYRRHLSRRRMTLAVAGAGVAVAAATGIAVAAAGTSPGVVKTQTAAYVVQRVSSALAATDTITYTSTLVSGPHMPHLHLISWWAYGTRARQLIENDGKPVTDVLNSISHGEDIAVNVIYPLRAWSVSTSPATGAPPAPDLCQTIVLPVADSAADWKNLIESGLRCGAFAVDGRERVDGVDAIRLIGRHFLPASTTLWVDPRSYLPVELVTYLDKADEERTEFRWLPPTRANLALLSPPIPAGFRELNG